MSKDYLIPFFDGDIIYDESFFPLLKKSETSHKGIYVKTLFDVCEIIKITNSTKEITYTAQKDYETRNNRLYIPEISAIPSLAWELYNPVVAPKSSFTISCTLGDYLLFGESNEITKNQYLITYKHKKQGKVFRNILHNEKNNGKLPLFREKIKNKTPLTFAFYGDSITVGANSSGFAPINIPPYQPIWAVMLCEKFMEIGIDITYVNKAVGGTTSAWGKDDVNKSFEGVKPDIFLIAFGMNDGSGLVPCEDYISNIDSLMQSVKKMNPDVEFVLVSTMLPNPLAKGFTGNQKLYEPLLFELAEKYEKKAAVVPFTSLHDEILKYKDYCDLTGNNVNHPNDFLAAAYAHAIYEVIS